VNVSTIHPLAKRSSRSFYLHDRGEETRTGVSGFVFSTSSADGPHQFDTIGRNEDENENGPQALEAADRSDRDSSTSLGYLNWKA
jgi:hypothetical protein